MSTRAEKFESSDAIALRKSGGEFCPDVSPLKDRDALYVLRAMRLNDFENALNAVEHFLGHLDLSEDRPTFNTAASWLDDVIDRFAEIDRDGDGHITRYEIDKWPACGEQLWVACHFDALSRAGLLPDREQGLTVRALTNARNVFHGLAIAQRHLLEITGTKSGESLVLSAEAIEGFIAKQGADLATADYLALLQLADYLKGLHKRFTLITSAEAEPVEAVSPETLWPEQQPTCS